MAKYKPDYWRKDDVPEPIDYATTEEPLHGADFEVGREGMMVYIRQAVECINAWVEDHSRNLDAMLARVKAGWISAGGNETTWQTIIKSAWGKSKYCKDFSKEANSVPPEKEEKFNELDLSGIKLK
jgi:hypothetical protein